MWVVALCAALCAAIVGMASEYFFFRNVNIEQEVPGLGV